MLILIASIVLIFKSLCIKVSAKYLNVNVNIYIVAVTKKSQCLMRKDVNKKLKLLSFFFLVWPHQQWNECLWREHLCQCDVQKMSVVIGCVFPGVLWSVQQIIDLDLSSFPLGQERCYQDWFWAGLWTKRHDNIIFICNRLLRRSHDVSGDWAYFATSAIEFANDRFSYGKKDVIGVSFVRV